MAAQKEYKEENLEDCQIIHADLRKYRYWYYNLHNSLISDYEYDMLEKKYDRLCDYIGINLELRVSEKVGWDDLIPMNLHNFYTFNTVLNRAIPKDDWSWQKKKR